MQSLFVTVTEGVALFAIDFVGVTLFVTVSGGFMIYIKFSKSVI